MPSPHTPLPHLAEQVLAALAAQILNGTLQGTVLMAAARLVCQDKWHADKMVLAHQKLVVQKAKEKAVASQRRKETALKLRALKLKKMELKRKLKQAGRPPEDSLAPPAFGFAPATQPADSTLHVPAPVALGGIAFNARMQAQAQSQAQAQADLPTIPAPLTPDTTAPPGRHLYAKAQKAVP